MPEDQNPVEPDDDFLDGCEEVLVNEDYDDDDTVALRPLFPTGDPEWPVKADEWRSLFPGDRSTVEIDGSQVTISTVAYRTGRDTGIADRLRAAGLKVVEVAGWKTRGSTSFNPRGSVDHHTAGSRNGNAPSLNICINGRSDLPGPLCHVLIGRDNTCFVVAAGRANHAGRGDWQGLAGNSSVYGIERENVGTTAEPWRADQTETAARAHAALLRGSGISANMLCEHKEWTRRKPDAHTVSGGTMRSLCARFLAGEEPAPPPQIPDKVRPMFDPPHKLQPIVDAKPAPEGGVILLGQDGSIYNYGGAHFFQGMNGSTHFVGRRAARLDYVGDPANPTAMHRWMITANTGETYHLPF